MALDSLTYKTEYHTAIDNVIEDFYVPCLKNSVSYQRVTAFFSGITFQILAHGLSPLIQNGGKMRLIISTQLSQQDEEAIKRGYNERELVEHELLGKFDDPTDEFGKGYLSLLTYLIAHNILDIRVAAVRSDSPHAIEHEKIGLFLDELGNTVTFVGSGNETPFGLKENSEHFEVFCSWNGDDPANRCIAKQMYFSRLWRGDVPGVTTYEFPEAVKERIFKYKDYLPREELIRIDEQYIEKMKREKLFGGKDPLPSFGGIKLRQYQLDAIQEWMDNNGRGYFDMATGTGKTFTALGAATTLVREKISKIKRFFCVIVVPYTHLATQWAEDCKAFGIEPLLAFGASSKWKRAFNEQIISIQLQQSKFECMIVTTASLQHDFVLEGLEAIKKKVIFIADEAHNLGAGKTSRALEIDYRFRIGLSATMDRHHDEAGTKKLYDFFEKCCIHYDLERAIKEKFLTPYHYHPIIVWLDDDELDEYIKLSKKISQMSRYEDPDESEGLKRLLLKRALIVAGCRMKLDALKREIKPYASDHHSLVYCGAVSYSDATDPTEETQLLATMSMLRNDLHMVVERFTSQENIDERQVIKEHFESKFTNALVAIKCLDEGVNIPCIARAFILASSTNPKEYIQRRGRVLRLFDPKEKPYAEIFDFITLSRNPDIKVFVDDEQLHFEASLAKRELTRVEEFSRLADNSVESYEVISKITSAYDLDTFKFEEDDYA